MTFTSNLRALLSSSACLLSLSSCVDHQSYKRLLPRPYEIKDPDSNALSAHPPVTQPPIPADEALSVQIKTLSDQALAGDTAFNDARTKLQPQLSAATTAAPQSEDWIAAQEARSALEAARAPTMLALTALDALYSNAMLNKGAGLEEIKAARANVVALVAAQDVVLKNGQ
jgi:hypothetical protein